MSSLTSNKSGNENEKEVSTLSEEDQRKEFNISVLRHMQMIFGHRAESKMQYYIPKGFWRQFRFGSGERVNLREQHDVVEFFNSIVDCRLLDESMKALSKEQICSKIKIDAVKHTCIKKLPIIIAIQLKRFVFFLYSL